MYRRAGNLARTALSSRGKKKEEAQTKSANIVRAITSQKERERFDRIGQSPQHNESLDPVGREDADIDNDGDIDKSDKYLHNRRKTIGKAIKKKSVKEGFSNWRQDLSEVIGDIETETKRQIKEKKNIKNKIKINPSLGEAVEELGGTLLEMVEIEDADCILDDLSESEIFLLSDKLIEEVVEEFFFECIQEGYNVEEIENVLIESIDVSAALLTEAKVTMGHDTDIKTDRLAKVKSAVKKVGAGLAREAGYVAGAAVRGVKAAGREFSKGYERGRGGSSSGSSSSSPAPQTSSSSSSSTETGSKRPGLLGRIGSALKKGLKKAVGAGARAVSRGARNVARRMENGETKKAEAPKPTPKKTEKPAAKKPAAPKEKAPAAKPAPKRKRTSKLDSLLSDIRSEGKEVTGLGLRLIDPYEKAPYSDDHSSAKKPVEMVKKAQKMKGVIKKEEVELDEKTLTAAETKKKEELVKSMKDKAADFEKRYPGRGKEVMYATATKMAKKIAGQTVDNPSTTVADPALEKKKQTLDKTKLTNLKMLQQKKQQLDRQRLQLQKAGKLPLETASYEPEGELVDENLTRASLRRGEERNAARKSYKSSRHHRGRGGGSLNPAPQESEKPTEPPSSNRGAIRFGKVNSSYELEGKVIDERRREDKGTPRKPRNPAFELVAKSMGSGRLGVQPRGVKKDKGAPTPGPTRTPAQKVAKRRADAQRAQDMMHSRYD